MPKPHYAFAPDIIERILSKMPGTVEELALSSGIHSSTVSRYMKHMYPSMSHVCGYKGNNPDQVTSNPAKIFGAGAGTDAVYVHMCNMPDYAERRKAYMKQRRQRARQEQGLDPAHERVLINLHAKATENISKALRKQNTLFGPLFDLQEKK